MWLRCRNPETGHEVSIPVDAVAEPWIPLDGAEPSDSFESPTYSTPPATPARTKSPRRPARVTKKKATPVAESNPKE